MLLAEFEVFHSRPIAPTRRVALGEMSLPVDPPPGFGGILLAGVAATFAPDLDDDLFSDLGRLLRQIERGERVPQPRLRHRFQHDRVGLTRVRHRLRGEGEMLHFDIDPGSATPAQHVLGTVYALTGLRPVLRARVADAVRVGIGWQGPIGPGLVTRLSGRSGTAAWSHEALADPVGWARLTLGIVGQAEISRAEVQRRFRSELRRAHPDHGAASEGAAQRIEDLAEARRILLS